MSLSLVELFELFVLLLRKKNQLYNLDTQFCRNRNKKNSSKSQDNEVTFYD